MGAAKAQQIDFSGILVSAGAGTQVTLTMPTTSENAGGNVSVFASATMTAIDLARQFTDALIENDLAEEVPAFKKTFKDSNDNELRQVVDLGDGKIQIQFQTTESTVGNISLTDSVGNMGTTSTPAVSTDTIFTSREYKAETFGTPTYPDATTAKRQILDNDDGTFTIQFLTEDEDIGPITSTIADDVDLTVNSAEVQAYQVTKPEIQILTFTAPANPITADSGGKKLH